MLLRNSKILLLIGLLIISMQCQIKEGTYIFDSLECGTPFEGVSIQISGGSITLKGGCNLHTGQIQSTQSHGVKIENFTSTKKMCAVDNDTALLKVFTNAASFSTGEEGVLVLKNSLGQRIASLIQTSAGATAQATGIQTATTEIKPDSTTSQSTATSGSATAHTTTTTSTDPDSASTTTVTTTTTIIQPAEGGAGVTESTGTTTTGTGSTTHMTSLGLPNLTFKPNLSADPNVLIVVEGNKVSIINGCNTQISTVSLSESGELVWGPFASTRMYCQNDNDLVYVNALRSSVRFVKQNNQYVFKTADGSDSIILNAPAVQGGSKPVQTDSEPLTFRDGEYYAGLGQESPDTEGKTRVRISGNTISVINGCNGNSGQYKATTSRTFSVKNFIGTLMFCENDTDRLYTKALTSSTRFTQTGDENTIVFMNPGYTKTITLKKAGSVQATQTSTGTYAVQPEEHPVESLPELTFKPNLSADPNVVIRVEGGRISIQGGCNVHTATITISETGELVFGPFASTRKACATDNDQVYLNALLNSVRFVKENNQYVFKTADGSDSIILNAPAVSELPSTPSQTTSKVIKFEDGEYYASLGQELPNTEGQTRVSINGNTINVINGCNINTGNYEATALSRKFSVKNFITTSKYCMNDDDALYTKALTSSNQYVQTGDGFTIRFFNPEGTRTITLQKAGLVNQDSKVPVTTTEVIKEQGVDQTKIVNQTPVEVPTPQSNSTATTTVQTTQQQASTTTNVVQPEEHPVESLPELTFKPNLSADPNVVIRVEGGQISIQGGCNVHTATITISEAGELVFGPFKSTRKACATDNDQVYLNALLNSVRFVKENNQYVFKTADGTNSITLNAPAVSQVSHQTSTGTTVVQQEGNTTTNVVQPEEDHQTTPATQVAEEPITQTVTQTVTEESQQTVLPNLMYKPNLSDDPNIVISINGNQVSILNGCNSHTSTFTFSETGDLVWSPFASSRRVCNNDNDEVYLNALRSSVRFVKENNQYVFKNADGTNSITLTAPAVSQVSHQTSTGTTVVQQEGSTTTSVVQPEEHPVESLPELTFKPNLSVDPNVVIRVEGGQISIQGGCNVHTATITISETGELVFGPFASTQRACVTDNDQVYLNALLNSVRFVKQNNQYVFKTADGSNSIILNAPAVSQASTGTTVVQQEGSTTTNILQPEEHPVESLPELTFKPNLSADPNVVIRVEGGRISIQGGCNVHTATITISETGELVFGPFASTRKACATDNDQVYLNALLSSVRFVKENNQYVFKTADGSDSIILNAPAVSELPSTPSQTTQTIVQTFTFEDGEYYAGLGQQSAGTAQKARIKIDGNTISVINGCNINTGTYQATARRTFSVKNFMSTSKYCQNDDDALYTQALTSSTQYVQTGDRNTIVFMNPGYTKTITLSYAGSEDQVPQTTTTTTVQDQASQTDATITLKSGDYSVGLGQERPESEGVKVNINGNRITVSGCNINSAKYQATSDNKIQISRFSSSYKLCQKDNDALYTSALTAATQYIQTGDERTIVFLNADHEQTISLRYNGQIEAPQGPITTIQVIEPEVVPTEDSTPSEVPVHQTDSSMSGQITRQEEVDVESQNPEDSTPLAPSTDVHSGSTTTVTEVPSSQSPITISVVQPGAASLATVSGTNNGIGYYFSMGSTYQIFDYFNVVTDQDAYFKEIINYLIAEYSYFLRDGSVIGAFRRHTVSGIAYQIIVKTKYGNFNAVVTYDLTKPEGSKIILKSLALIDFDHLLYSYRNCEVRNKQQGNCSQCEAGFGNFKGRCYEIQEECQTYATDECSECKSGSSLKDGKCVQQH